jgi:rRNA processing protein Krr1/Pno1
MVGRIIGKQGDTIKALETHSGAHIHIDQTVEPSLITIGGSQWALQLAVNMITDIMEGTFKGFVLLRQTRKPTPRARNKQQAPRSGRRAPIYAPGYGLIPPSEVCCGVLQQ